MTHCNHIEQIIGEPKLRDNVMKTFNITKYILTHSSQNDKLMYTMCCSTCNEVNAGSSFICLQCEYVGCWNNTHFKDHSVQKNHIFGINSSNQLLYCFKCQDYVGDVEMINSSFLNKSWDEINSTTDIPQMKRRDGLYGFINMGSTCFISSVIQCLIHNPYIVNFSMSQQHYNKCQIKDPTGCISCSLDIIIAESYGNMGNKNSDSRTPVDPHEGFISFLNCAWKINQNFAGYSQQDAHEFLQFLLNQLHNDYKRVEHRTSTTTDGSSCKCLIHSMFQGALKSSIVCSSCNDDSKTIIDPFMDLSLDIKDKTTLYNCLDSFHKRETLNDYHYHCPQCDTTDDPTKQLTIDKLGSMLTLQLKRFEHLPNGNNVKLTNFVEYPLYLNVTKYFDDGKTDHQVIAKDITFELIGVVSHKGTVNEGHYISTLKVNEDKWFRFNDSMVSEISQEQALNDEAYLLFYMIKEVK
ncbi:similar to Saccharomyces cerevisiae YMR223W UBP8 Ubiquitin-specific protease that is a component of the SAGA (Spt-Ada-Gcn5-Acetyltransferase) acetylation complex [Maudiozyma saulgeensis]|uniref:Ubiquitin carboxyl-terminal hydrolase n=1 Tax=Maudiozyma saulgeensis TaxID=1789683 RepID=A0A1X7R4E0_9SACH|nr:similar to Saccharomyces cerevisiae YMR223W UBP8 Ubiquitin-specific protease that is a component of the SAGA (Spt-Ada-Gcn5-Acetyltransferase) acetylation complex [Kazachstania saulgeensis]